MTIPGYRRYGPLQQNCSDAAQASQTDWNGGRHHSALRCLAKVRPSKAMTCAFSALRVDGQGHVELALDEAQAAGARHRRASRVPSRNSTTNASSASVRTLPRPHGRIGDAGSAPPLAHGLGGQPVQCGEGAAFSAREDRLELAAPVSREDLTR
jgi:hypothetical protein